ncbi:aminotransferase class I/II-fold pyridoxal phosphate-dependent enzyme [Lactobacillus delbrueckii]|uniref:aminotransferase class I/II-fold pyridoxal phosphate-dependent enzyme n=1 Tax=Lactobacillus delbrueckii TaxID=1584 RepID=UPI003A8422FA
MPKLAQDLLPIINHKLDAVVPSDIRRFDKYVSQFDDVVKLTLGEPDLNTPEHIKQAAIRDIENNDSHYGPQSGKPELLQAIGKYVKGVTGVDYDPASEITVTVGATEALNCSLSALLNDGDKVIVPTPVWSMYMQLVCLTGATPVEVDTSDTGFILTPEKLEEVIEREGKGVKAVMLNDPTNPTGITYPKEVIEGLAEVIKKHHMYAISDEIYSELIYGDAKHYSLATYIPDRTIFISGLSKSHAMTGWRLGYICGPAEIMASVRKMNDFMITVVTNNVQAAAIEALTNGLDDPKEFRDIYQRRVNFMEKGLKKLGFDMALPRGAFYIFAKIPEKYQGDDVGFAKALAKDARVGVIPGSYFGAGGAGYVRMSYASSDEVLKEALKRITKFVEAE